MLLVVQAVTLACLLGLEVPRPAVAQSNPANTSPCALMPAGVTSYKSSSSVNTCDADFGALGTATASIRIVLGGFAQQVQEQTRLYADIVRELGGGPTTAWGAGGIEKQEGAANPETDSRLKECEPRYYLLAFSHGPYIVLANACPSVADAVRQLVRGIDANIKASLLSHAVYGSEDSGAGDFLKADAISLDPAGLPGVISDLREETNDGRRITTLFLIGHGGVAPGGGGLNGAIAIGPSDPGNGAADYGAADFIAAQAQNPDLSDRFTPGATVYLLNCDVGQDTAFVTAVGNLFLGSYGGTVWAKTGSVVTWSLFDGWYYWIETPTAPSADPRASGDWVKVLIPSSKFYQ